MVVAPGSAMLFQSMSAGRRPSEPWPVTYWRRRARSRWVSETPSRLAAPWAALMPGTTSTAMPAARQAVISSVARPKIIRSPPLTPTPRLPALARVTTTPFIPSARPAARRLRQARKAAGDRGAALGPHRHAKPRRSAIGGDADDERRAVDDRPKGKVAEGGLIDDVHRHAAGAGRGGKLCGVPVVCESADRHGGAGEIVSRDVAAGDRDGAAPRGFGQPPHLISP